MRLRDILKPEWVKVPLAAGTKPAAIEELVGVLLGSGEAAEELKKAVLAREALRTTGIGQGVGIPHAKSRHVSHLVMAVGKPAEPIPFGAVDGRPVELIFLVVSPEDQTGAHVRALAVICRLLTEEGFRASLKKALTAERLFQLLVERDVELVA